jgi:hypothetical protein
MYNRPKNPTKALIKRVKENQEKLRMEKEKKDWKGVSFDGKFVFPYWYDESSVIAKMKWNMKGLSLYNKLEYMIDAEVYFNENIKENKALIDMKHNDNMSVCDMMLIYKWLTYYPIKGWIREEYDRIKLMYERKKVNER